VERSDRPGGTEAAALFERAVCAVDGTEAAVEAVRQAARLAPPQAPLLLLSVACPPAFADAAFVVPIEALREDGEAALATALAAVPLPRPVETRLLEGPVVAVLRAELERERATLLSVGSHRGGRGAGIVLGSVATTLLHDAPCSVLVARTPPDPAAFPRSIAVGFDGSPEARRALAAGRELAGRLGATLTAVVAHDGKLNVDTLRSAAAELAPEAALAEGSRHPVEALTESGADLVVVGSRGLHGLHALGSVSERVAHRARSSVLVVRARADSP
jgi:nucleotide-binding universal stress UspA family protein